MAVKGDKTAMPEAKPSRGGGVVIALRRQTRGKRATVKAAKLREGMGASNKKVAQLNSESARRDRRRIELKKENRRRQDHKNVADQVTKASEKLQQPWSAERDQLIAQLAERGGEIQRLETLLAQQQDMHRQALKAIQDLEQSRRNENEERRALTERHELDVKEIERRASALAQARERHQKISEQVKRLQAGLAKKATASAKRAARVSHLEDDARRRTRYVEQVKARFAALRKTVEQQHAADGVESHKAALESAIEAARAAALLRHSGGLSALLRGAATRAGAQPKERSVLRALQLRYRLVRMRTDAADLALMAGSGLFDPDYYLEQYEDVAKAGVDPLIHFADHGAEEVRNPSALFDTAYYLKTNPDVAAAGGNPLLHFITSGRQEGRLTRGPQPRKLAGNWTLPPEPAPAAQRLALVPARSASPAPAAQRLALVPARSASPAPKPQRIVIYTAVAGGYDELKSPGFSLPGCDFIVFRDQGLKVDGWQVRPFNYFHVDPTRMARFVKLHPHVYFPEYDHSIWVDANIGIQGDIRQFLDRLTSESPMAMFPHPYRDCVYVEGAECIKREKDSADVINRHLDRYRAEGVPERAGMWETGVLARRHNDPACIALMSAWWREIEAGSRRDQLSLPAVARRLSVPIAALDDRPGANARDHHLVTFVHHPKERRLATGTALPAAPRKPVHADRIAVDIGVCVHNSLEETRACLHSLLAARRPHDRIVVIDDASAAPTAAFLDQFAREHDRVVLRRHESNRGYTASANAFFREGRAEWLVLLNSDTVLPLRALTKLVRCGEQFDALGVVGPLSNAASWQTVPQLSGLDGKWLVNAFPPGLSVEDMDRLCEELAPAPVLFAPLLNGFCLTIRRAMLEKIGPFDEASFPMGYGEEDDFSLRASAAGYVCGIAPDTYVYHVKSASFTPEGRKPLVEAGAKALRLKHSPERLAAAVATMRGHPELARMRERMSLALQPGEMRSSAAE